MLNGCVFATPAIFLCGRPVLHRAPRESILNPWYQFHEGSDAWFVYIAAGDLASMLRYVPYPLDFVGFSRQVGKKRGSDDPCELKFYPLKRMEKLASLRHTWVHHQIFPQ